jgi:hypothetical protein
MKVFKVVFIVAVMFLLINPPGVFAELPVTYTNDDLAGYKGSPQRRAGVFTNADLKIYQERNEEISQKPWASKWRDNISYICHKSTEAGYLLDSTLSKLLTKSDSLKRDIEDMSIAESQKYALLITLENCRQELLTETLYRDKEYEIKKAEKRLRQELKKKDLSEQEAFERLNAFKIRNKYERIHALRIRFCDYRQDQHASYISCGQKLRQDGHPDTAMKLRDRLDSCLNPDTCFYTTERAVENN